MAEMQTPTLTQRESLYFTADGTAATALPLLSKLTGLAKSELLKLRDDVPSDSIPDETSPFEDTLLQLIENGLGPQIKDKTVTIVGAGCSGLCAGRELKRAGFKVRILEVSSRVGGRVITFRDPIFAPGLHGEGGAMRIPQAHKLTLHYVKEFGLGLFPFEMKNKFIYISGYKNNDKVLTYDEFDSKLTEKDPDLLACFPGLKDSEVGFTCDQLFDKAIKPVIDDFNAVYRDDPTKITAAYKAITEKYDKYSLRSFLTEVAGWSKAAINLFDLGNAHVVFENGFIESLKDAFLSSNDQGIGAKMQQPQNGMDQLPQGFIKPNFSGDFFTLIDDITFGARVSRIERARANLGVTNEKPIKVYYDSPAGEPQEPLASDYLIVAIPYTAQRSITKNEAFDPLQEMAIRQVRYVEVTKVLLQYKKRWWQEIFEREGKGTDGGLVTDLPIRYTMFPKVDKNNPQIQASDRGVVMAAYTFEQDATILGAMSPAHRIQLAARNLDTIFPRAKSLELLEAGASQVFPADALAGGSAFCYFGPGQKTDFLPTMQQPDWDKRVFFAGEQVSYSHGWIQGALEAGINAAYQLYKAASPEVST